MDELLLQHTLVNEDERAVAATLVAGVELARLDHIEPHNPGPRPSGNRRENDKSLESFI
jgi:hypothetical protein